MIILKNQIKNFAFILKTGSEMKGRLKWIGHETGILLSHDLFLMIYGRHNNGKFKHTSIDKYCNHRIIKSKYFEFWSFTPKNSLKNCCINSQNFMFCSWGIDFDAFYLDIEVFINRSRSIKAIDRFWPWQPSRNIISWVYPFDRMTD